MLNPSFQELAERGDSRYTLVVLAAKRARDIVAGKPVLTDSCSDDAKTVTIAAHEIMEDVITYKR